MADPKPARRQVFNFSDKLVKRPEVVAEVTVAPEAVAPVAPEPVVEAVIETVVEVVVPQDKHCQKCGRKWSAPAPDVCPGCGAQMEG